MSEDLQIEEGEIILTFSNNEMVRSTKTMEENVISYNSASRPFKWDYYIPSNFNMKYLTIMIIDYWDRDPENPLKTVNLYYLIVNKEVDSHGDLIRSSGYTYKNLIPLNVNAKRETAYLKLQIFVQTEKVKSEEQILKRTNYSLESFLRSGELTEIKTIPFIVLPPQRKNDIFINEDTMKSDATRYCKCVIEKMVENYEEDVLNTKEIITNPRISCITKNSDHDYDCNLFYDFPSMDDEYIKAFVYNLGFNVRGISRDEALDTIKERLRLDNYSVTW